MSAPASSPERQRSRRELARTGGLVALAVLITLFAVFNLDSVKVDWILGSGHAPLIVVIVVSLLVGIALTHFSERRIGRRR
ncbi:MAG TPA: hypothetical protein VLJ42_09505 [Solirubrobacteraceae bacterium]|nr:hypothetical protein [Solirubrobacteraceae bacterium]